MRTAVKTIGLTLLLPSLALALAPLLSTYTDLLNGLDPIRVQALNHTIFELRSTAQGMLAQTSPWVWGTAALGEAIIIAMQILSPRRKDLNRLTIRP